LLYYIYSVVMYIILFLSIISGFVSCAPATVTNETSLSSASSVNCYADANLTSNPLHFIWPVNGEIVSKFGASINHTSNKGINIKAKPQETVVASESGQVAFADHIKGWGKTLILRHQNDFYTVYANLEGIKVKQGFLVKKGDSIGHVAQLASGKGSVLHFEIRKRHLADNPLYYLKVN
jgi:lipoprotein NlpD